MPAPLRPLEWPLLRRSLAKAALAGAAALLALPALEIGYRLHVHRPMLALEDWRAGRIEHIRFGDRTRFDAALGWVPRDEVASTGYNTLKHGIRRNFCEKAVRTGGILAVGDIFTDGGNEVADGETWPALLERLIDVPVLNAGVSGYGVDQIALRAEQLLPAVQPRTLVVGVFEETIARVRYATFGSPKPHFTIERGSLVHRAPTPLPGEQTAGLRNRVRAALGHSAVLDALLAHAAPVYWLGNARQQELHTVDNDPVAVTCALLRRLRARAEAQGVRMLLLMQYARKTVERAEPGTDVRQVAACANALGMDVIDQIDALRAAVAESSGALNDLYLQSPGFGQMTPKGNRATAQLLAGALTKMAALRK
jgi:hypothetical protein